MPGTGGTLAHKLINPESLPDGNLLFVGAVWGTSAVVQFKFLSCFSGEESEESSNINSPFVLSASIDLGEKA